VLALVGSAGLLAPVGSQDLRALCLTREAVAARSTLADALIAIQAIVATPLLLGGSDEQRGLWLEPLLSGRAIGAFAMSEPEAGSDVASIRTTARAEGDSWILHGEKHLISNAGIADLYLVFARTTADGGSRGLSAFLVPAETEGLRFVRPQVTAAPHPLGTIALEGCRVPATAIVGERDRGFHLGMATLERVRPSVGAAACGMAGRALSETLAHAASRRQFGEPLAGFQIVREKIGRMATLLEASRLLVYRAAWQRDRYQEGIALESAMAKSFATESAQAIVDDAVQLAGGLGVVIGHPVEHLYRAVRALRIYEGTTEIQRLIVAGELLGRP
jgi:acyl-CoA dehydrogenase